MNINWQEIKEKYPKGYEVCRRYFNISSNYPEDWGCLCFCDIETFFDNNNLFIEISFHAITNNWRWEIYTRGNKGWWLYIDFGHVPEGQGRPEAKIEAIKKAFEIFQIKQSGNNVKAERET
jgi:hypothetical protein